MLTSVIMRSMRSIARFTVPTCTSFRVLQFPDLSCGVSSNRGLTRTGAVMIRLLKGTADFTCQFQWFNDNREA